MTYGQKKLNRGEKILLFLYESGKDIPKKRFVYEDISVGLFKKYPDDFHLKGYPEYPDSSDSSQRLLYEFKKRGYVNAANKIFSLTDSGLEFAQKILDRKSSAVDISSIGRHSRATIVETNRIKKLEGFVLFVEGKANQLTEGDFYNYLGITARTSSSTFSGRMKSIETSMNEIKEYKNDPLFSKIIEYHEFLISKNENIISYFPKKKL